MVAYRVDLKERDVVCNKYQIVKNIGNGSYGDVYLVKDAYGFYAMKVLRLFDEPSDLHEELVQRFRQEYDTAQMPGKYFIHSIAYSEIKGNPFFTMEYCPQGDLAKYVGTNTLLLPKLAQDVLMGLNNLHSCGKIHRDLKPENVLVRDDGTAALTDFGAIFNKRAPKRISSRNIINKPKQRFGSPLYMAPEMNDLKGGGVTYLPTIDIFSFGVMLYELLTNGQFPFGNPQNISDLPLYQANAKRGLWRKHDLCTSLHGKAWFPIIEKCLKPNYQDRYQNVLDIIKDLEPLIGTPGPVIDIERSPMISRLIITQGEGTGSVYNLEHFLKGKGRMIRVGRNSLNDIVLSDKAETFVSRFHFTVECSPDKKFYVIKDGQWQKDIRQWQHSTNGTYLNASRVTENGQKLYTGDIITAGEFKFKVE